MLLLASVKGLRVKRDGHRREYYSLVGCILNKSEGVMIGWGYWV